MSHFLDTLKTEQVDKWNRVLLADLNYFDDELGPIRVPSGFTTDFASIKALHNIFLFVLYALVAGYGNYAATVHDWLYTDQKHLRRVCDDVLYRALRAEGVATWRAWLFWVGVRLGGGRQYRL